MDGTTGKIIYASNATAPRYPASLTKMMTLYLLFEQLKQGKISLSSMITASEHAAEQHPTKLGLAVGELISVELAIEAIVVRSANDVAVAIAESLGGSEPDFAAMMTREAHKLGMSETIFRNASGLPNPGQTTTAHDLALLGRHLAYDFPEYYHYFSTPSFTYQGRIYETHDNLLSRFEGTDGIKTGYTNASGFNLVSSVVREGKHIIGVVMGGRTARSRDNEMMELLATTLDRSQHNPTLLAKADVPWQDPNTPKPSMMVASSESDVTRSLNLHVNGFEDTSTPLPATDDEDAAEAMTANAATPGPAHAPAPAPGTAVASATAPLASSPLTVAQAASQPVAISPAPQPALVWTGPMPQQKASQVLAFTPPTPMRKPATAPDYAQAVLPTPKPAAIASKPAPKQQMVVASLGPSFTLTEPAPKPAATAQAPAANTPPAQEEEEGDIGGPSLPAQVAPHPAVAAGVKQWAVQIGAFADEKTAKTQLALYAERSMDVLRRAQRVIIPFDSVDGHKLFRARFGPFAENEAREVCRRMSERGQTCFAAIISN